MLNGQGNDCLEKELQYKMLARVVIVGVPMATITITTTFIVRCTTFYSSDTNVGASTNADGGVVVVVDLPHPTDSQSMTTIYIYT